MYGMIYNFTVSHCKSKAIHTITAVAHSCTYLVASGDLVELSVWWRGGVALL